MAGAVFRKTAKGQLEIETRVDRLAPRLRTALIVVDGKRSRDELARLVPDPNALDALLQSGHIEALAQAPAQTPPARAAASLAVQAPAAPVAGIDRPEFKTLQRAAARHVNDKLGPAADMLALRIEQAVDWAQLQAPLGLARQLLRAQRGAAAAAEFERLFVVPAAAPESAH